VSIESENIDISGGRVDAVDLSAGRVDKAKIAAIRTLAARTADHVRAHRPKIYSHELVNVLFAQPYCRIRNLEAAGVAKRQTASRYLHALADIGVLREHAVGREKLFVHPKLLELLTRDGNEVGGIPRATGGTDLGCRGR
jgi:hypothetical protein